MKPGVFSFWLTPARRKPCGRGCWRSEQIRRDKFGSSHVSVYGPTLDPPKPAAFRMPFPQKHLALRINPKHQTPRIPASEPFPGFGNFFSRIPFHNRSVRTDSTQRLKCHTRPQPLRYSCPKFGRTRLLAAEVSQGESALEAEIAEPAFPSGIPASPYGLRKTGTRQAVCKTRFRAPRFVYRADRERLTTALPSWRPADILRRDILHPGFPRRSRIASSSRGSHSQRPCGA